MDTGSMLALLTVAWMAGYEGFALADPRKGDTWSERVQSFRNSAIGRIVVGGGTLWLAYHWGLDRVAGLSWIDAAVAGAGALATSIAGPVKAPTSEGGSK